MNKLSSQSLAALNSFFDHIYVLTLQRATDRHKQIPEVLDGLNWSFFYGVDKLNLEKEQVDLTTIYDDRLHQETKRTNRSMNIGEVACALSHRSIYENMIEQGYKHVLILEDDVLPIYSKLQHFEQVASQLPVDWELLMLGYYGEKFPNVKMLLKANVYRLYHHLKLFNWHKVAPALIDQLCLQPYSPDLYEIGKVLGAHSYAISASAASKFIAYQHPVKLQADRVFNYYKAEHDLNAFAVKDKLFTLSELSKKSYIGYD